MDYRVADAPRNDNSSFLTPAPAFAMCSTPAGVAGEVDFNGDYNMLQYCDNTNWVPMYFNDYWANAVTFDGTNDYLMRGADLTGSADSKMFTSSFWFRRNGGDGTDRLIIRNGDSGTGLRIYLNMSNELEVLDSSSVIEVTGSTAITDSNWHHVMMSFDMSNTSRHHIYLDGIAETLNVTTYNNSNIDFTLANHAIGAGTSGSGKFNGDLADVWHDMGTYIDLSDADERAKFRDSRGKPMHLGTDGSRPTGTAPEIFLSGATAGWETNDGTGGGFTENGALTSAASSPSNHNIATSTDPCAPVNTPSPGDDCDDGSVYAGDHPVTSEPMYVLPADSSSISWNDGAGNYTTTSVLSTDDGAANTATLIATDSNSVTGGNQPHNAAQLCADSNFSTHTDWFLPAVDELFTIYSNAVAIGGFNTTGGYPVSWYWTSTESDNMEGRMVRFTDGSTGITTQKDAPHPIRCVRTGYEQVACTNPFGVAGTMMYNDDDDVMQFCDGKDWLAMAEGGNGGAGCTSPAGAAGEIIYNADWKTMQYCEGDEWIGIGKGCREVPGDECEDGTVYAGLSPDGNVAMYTSHCDYGATWNGSACTGSSVGMAWNNGNSSGYTTVGVTDWSTGEANTALIIATDADSVTGGTQPHQSAQYCTDLTAHGHDDWYLPAVGELAVMNANKGLS